MSGSELRSEVGRPPETGAGGHRSPEEVWAAAGSGRWDAGATNQKGGGKGVHRPPRDAATIDHSGPM